MKEYLLQPRAADFKSKINYAGELNDEQLQVVKEGDGPCLVLAGAGSGKTRTLIYRLAYLLEHGVSPGRILLVTFTNKAAKEMLNRIEGLLQAKPQGLWSGTFHHVGNRLLRIYGDKIGLAKNFNILDAEDAKSLVKSCLAGLSLPADKTFPKADLIYKMISLAANLDRPFLEIAASRFGQRDQSHLNLLSEIADRYRQKKQQAEALDFDDLLTEWLRLLRQDQATRQLLARKFQYILVDEYQDTNPIQGEIVATLAGAEQNILVVGDDSQSIYSFRGADVNNILNFTQVFPQAKTFRLEKNYRSTPEILALANESIKNNHHQFDKTLQAQRSTGDKPAVVAVDDNQEQARFICQRLADLEQNRQWGPSEFAVLFRAHYQSLELEMELNKRNIPYIMRGGLRFFEQAHVKDVVCQLRLIANYRDEASWRRLLLLQPGIGPVLAQKIWERLSQLSSLQEALSFAWREELPARSWPSWQKVSRILSELLAVELSQTAKMIELIISRDYRDYLKGVYENYQERLDDLEELRAFAENYDDLEKFLADAALGEGFKSEVRTATAATSQAVTLSTIHQAKGLEWPAVFVIGLAEGQFPNAKSSLTIRELEEERRLFYVAVTRAEQELYLLTPRLDGRSFSLNQPSPFIQELPTSVFEDWRLREKRLAPAADEVVYVSEEEEFEDVAANFWQRVAARRPKK